MSSGENNKKIIEKKENKNNESKKDEISKTNEITK
jgi:hypothetical protein